jgi:hypothetical protein
MRATAKTTSPGYRTRYTSSDHPDAADCLAVRMAYDHPGALITQWYRTPDGWQSRDLFRTTEPTTPTRQLEEQ